MRDLPAGNARTGSPARSEGWAGVRPPCTLHLGVLAPWGSTHLGHAISVDFSLVELRSRIATWRDREGVVVLTTRNRLYKIKSRHYRLLHGAIEGPNYDISRWRLILAGDEDALLAAASRRQIDLHHYVATAHTLLARVAERVRSWCERYEGDRGAFARGLPLAGLAKHWTFRALDGADLEPMIRKDLLHSLESRSNWQWLMEQLQEWEGESPG